MVDSRRRVAVHGGAQRRAERRGAAHVRRRRFAGQGPGRIAQRLQLIEIPSRLVVSMVVTASGRVLR